MSLGTGEILVVLALLGACIVVPAVVVVAIVLTRKSATEKGGA